MPQLMGHQDEVREVPGGLEITRTSTFTNRRHTMTLPITRSSYERWRVGRALIQDEFGGLSPDEREFLMTGATPEEWDDVFGSPEEEEDAS